MALYWRCQCGELFKEYGREDPGNAKGWFEAQSHVKQHKKNKEPERIEGLIDSETGEIVFEGGMRPLAVKQGILPAGNGVTASGGVITAIDGGKRKTPYLLHAFIKNIELGYSSLLFFEEARRRWPDVYPDDSPRTMSKFIDEIIAAYFIEHSDEFPLGRVLQDSLVEYLSEKEQNEDSGNSVNSDPENGQEVDQDE